MSCPLTGGFVVHTLCDLNSLETRRDYDFVAYCSRLKVINNFPHKAFLCWLSKESKQL